MEEANDNKFATNGEIIKRRDELVGQTNPAATALAGDELGSEKSPAATATPAATAAAGEGTEHPEWFQAILDAPEGSPKHHEDGQVPDDSM